jgi:hypothetical protein
VVVITIQIVSDVSEVVFDVGGLQLYQLLIELGNLLVKLKKFDWLTRPEQSLLVVWEEIEAQLNCGQDLPEFLLVI